MKREKSLSLIEEVKSSLELDGFKVIPNFKTRFNKQYIFVNLIAINEKGVYLITTKNLNGTVAGNYKDAIWITEYNGGSSYELYNTMKALFIPQQALMTILKEFGVRPFTTTIFSNKTRIALKNAHPYSILNLDNMDRFFKSSKFKKRLSESDVEKIHQKLVEINVED